jgi:hypothetical protein
MIEVSATLAAMGVAIAVVTPIAGADDNATAHRELATTAAFARLSAIPSHNGIYRASLARSVDPGVWTVNVQTTAGTAVGGATLALERWMPDDERLAPTRLRVTQNLGGGRYRVEGLRFDRRGWWNVKLQVSAPNGTDSLAFNLVR